MKVWQYFFSSFFFEKQTNKTPQENKQEASSAKVTSRQWLCCWFCQTSKSTVQYSIIHRKISCETKCMCMYVHRSLWFSRLVESFNISKSEMKFHIEWNMISAVHFYSHSKKRNVKKLASKKQTGHKLKVKNFIHNSNSLPK